MTNHSSITFTMPCGEESESVLSFPPYEMSADFVIWVSRSETPMNVLSILSQKSTANSCARQLEKKQELNSITVR